MNIVRKVRAVEKLFKTLEKDIEKLKIKTGIHCVDNCIKCCTTPKIVATSLEFYPLAFFLFRTGQAEDFLAKIEKINDDSICPMLNNLRFDNSRLGCLHYDNRGLICRLFSYNYALDKHGIRRIAACKTMRINQPEQLNLVNSILLEKPIGPRASSYYARLQFIDFYQAQKLYPIATAIKIAIESIIMHSHYKGKKVG